MVIPLIITGHTSCEDRSTIVDSRGDIIDVIINVEICKKNNPNLKFYTIYSVDDTIQDAKYVDYFDKVLYSENITQRYAGEKVKIETALNYIVSEKTIEWKYFIKICSRIILNNIEPYVVIKDSYDYIGNTYQTVVQYDTAMFIGNRKLVNTWIACEPKINIVSNIKTEKNWLCLYNVFLLENLFWNRCRIDNIRELLIPGLYGCNFISK